MRRDSSGQAALVDSIIFMILMLLASGIILGSSGSIGPAPDTGLQQYADDFADTLLSMEIGNGSMPVSRILCDQAILGNQSDAAAWNSAIMESGNALVQPGLGYAVACQGVFLSNHASGIGDLPADRQASRRDFMVLGNHVEITVYVWVVG